LYQTGRCRRSYGDPENVFRSKRWRKMVPSDAIWAFKICGILYLQSEQSQWAEMCVWRNVKVKREPDMLVLKAAHVAQQSSA